GVDPLPLDIMREADDRGFGHKVMGHQRAFDFRRPHAMAGDVDHVIYPPGDPIISILIAAGAVAGEIKPRVIREVSLDEAFVIAVDCAHLARPAVLHAEHPRTWTFENITLVVNHHGLNAE